MKLKPMIGERQKFRDTMPFWARYRIYVILSCALVFVIVSLVTLILTVSMKEIRDALLTSLALIPAALLVLGLAFWYRRSRRNRKK